MLRTTPEDPHFKASDPNTGTNRPRPPKTLAARRSLWARSLLTTQGTPLRSLTPSDDARCPPRSLPPRGGGKQDHFSGKQRTLEMQLQGRFKSKPRGVLYVGGELGGKMELGFVTKSLAKVLLGAVQRLSGVLHYSFGTKGKAAGAAAASGASWQRHPAPPLDGLVDDPHICYPLWQAVDRLVVTPQGEQPPPLGVTFPETEAARKLRRKAAFFGEGEMDTTSTLSFSFHTMYVDPDNGSSSPLEP